MLTSTVGKLGTAKVGVLGIVVGVLGVTLGVRGERDRGRRTRSETGVSTTFFDIPPVDFLAVFFPVRTIVG